MKACLRSILASACCLMATAALAGPRIVFDAGGPTLRLHPDAAAAFKIRGFAAGDGAAAVTGREAKFVDLTDLTSGEGVRFTQLAAPKTAKFYVWPDGRFVTPSALYDGPVSLKKGETLNLAYKLAVHADGRVKGALAKRPVERMDRGLVVALTPQGTYLSWRLLETDRPDRGFDVWRKVGDRVEKLTSAPIVQTCDLALPGYLEKSALYSLDGERFESVTAFTVKTDGPFRRFPLANTNDTPGQVGVGDLDGDGKYDFVIKVPAGGTGWTVDFPPTEIDLKPGGHWSKKMPISRPSNPKGRYDFTVTLTRPGEPPLVLHQPQWL